MEGRYAALQGVSSICSGNMQRVKSKVAADIRALCVDALPRETDIYVEQQAWCERIGSAHPNNLNSGACVSQLPAKRCIAFRWT